MLRELRIEAYYGLDSHSKAEVGSDTNFQRLLTIYHLSKRNNKNFVNVHELYLNKSNEFY